MKTHHQLLSPGIIMLLSVSLIIGVSAWVDARQKAKSAEQMASAAQNFLATLTPEQKAKATFALGDDQRQDWHFVPQDRKGLPLKQMNDTQRKAALELLRVSLSQKGYTKATSIVALEPVLEVLEGPDRRHPRDPGLYYVTIFGDPSKGNAWGWRFEGHHISQNFTVARNSVIVDAPAFFGTNPAEVPAGMPNAGLRVLANEEDLARTFMQSLNEVQKKRAIYDPTAPGDILTFDKRQAQPLPKIGIRGSDLNDKQWAKLNEIIEEYIQNVPDDVAAARRAKFKATKKEDLYFAWAGPIERRSKEYTLEARDLKDFKSNKPLIPGLQGHYYRIQTPTFLIEYDNTQNNSNHIHSVWRDYQSDWGQDLLSAHYQAFPHPQSALKNIARK